MSVVIQVLGLADGRMFKRPAYVQSYRPELLRAYRQGQATELEAEEYLYLTDKRAWAWRYPDQAAALEAWRYSIGVREWDGMPDRPLTAFHVSIFDPDREGAHA
jgi:hypothetical protein